MASLKTIEWLNHYFYIFDSSADLDVSQFAIYFIILGTGPFAAAAAGGHRGGRAIAAGRGGAGARSCFSCIRFFIV